MGKIRVKTLGDEEQEKVDKKKTEARAAAKKAKEEAESRKKAEEATEGTNGTEAEEKTVEVTEAKSTKKSKKEKFVKAKKQTRSASYLKVVEKVDKTKVYKLQEALTLLPELKVAKFDETVELHINTTEKGIAGAVTLPHGTGKSVRVTIVDGADAKNVDEVVKKIEAGQIDFDILIATPDAMAKLARVARVLGPKGLMPNPKNGTVTPKPLEAAKKFEGGQMNFKTESKFPIMHLSIGKISFGEKKLSDNIKAAVAAVNAKKIKDVTLKSTMSPGMKLDVASL